MAAAAADEAALAAVCAAVARSAVEGACARVAYALQFRLDMTVARVASLGVLFEAAPAEAGALVASGGEGLGGGGGRFGAVVPAGVAAGRDLAAPSGGSPWNDFAAPGGCGLTSSARWRGALDWRSASPACFEHMSEKEAAKHAVPDGRTVLDPIVECYLGGPAARVVRGVRSRCRSRNAGRPLTGPPKPRTMAEAVAKWQRDERRRRPPMTQAERETNWTTRSSAVAPAYDALRDKHCTYTLGTAFAASPYKAALEATRPGYRDDLLRAPRVRHNPKWPAPSHLYRDYTVLPLSTSFSTSEPGMDRRHALTSAGAAKRRDRTYHSSVAHVEGKRSRVYHVADSKTTYNSGTLHPVDGSLGPEEGSLHWASIPARNWFKLQSEKTRSFHGDSWIDIVEANAIHSTTNDLAKENRAISNLNPKRLHWRKRAAS